MAMNPDGAPAVHRTGDTRILRLVSLPLGILLIGAAVRTFFFFERGSLWIDEAYLALNIVHRSPRELLDELSFNQAAPWGFLLAEKLVIGILGVDELTLRLVPLLAGLAALAVFWRVASFCLRGPELPLALLFFALSPSLVGYSAEAKQYSVDVVASLLALWLLHAAREVASLRRSVAVAGAAATLLWFSHASMIVLAAGGATIAVASLLRRERRSVRPLAFLGAASAVSAAAFFALAWPKLAHLRGTLSGSVYDIAFPPTTLAEAASLRRAGDVLEAPFGLHGTPWSTLIGLTAASLFVMGTVSLWRRDRSAAALYVAPLVAAGAAVAAGLYPFAPRFLLFLLPCVVLLVAAGVGAGFRGGARLHKPWRFVFPAAALAGATFLLSVAAVSTAQTLRADGQDLAPVLKQLRTVWRPGDVLYLHGGSQYAARFYAEVDGVNRSRDGAVLWPVLPTAGRSNDAPALRSAPPTLLVGASGGDARASFSRDLVALEGKKRVWFVFSHVVRSTENGWVGDLEWHLAALDAAGQRRATIRRGVLAVLYDFSG